MDLVTVTIVLLTLLPLFIYRLTRKFIYLELLAVPAIIFYSVYFFGYKSIFLLLITYIVSTVAELLSLKTKFNIFGAKYRYSLNHRFFASGVTFLKVYPLEISLAWIIFKFLSFIIGLIICDAFGLPAVFKIIIIPLILVSLDLLIDPVAVNIAGLWEWEKGSAYFGIPAGNFTGWFAVGLVCTVLISWTGGDFRVAFHVLHLLPVLFYASFICRAGKLIKINPKMAVFGMIPLLSWSVLGLAGLLRLYLI
jgi:putative membrane protein